MAETSSEGTRALAERAERVAAARRGRFVHWDEALWRELCDGPARRLEAGLARSGMPQASAAALLGSWLELAAEGVGEGYLFPEASGPASFLGSVWRERLPEALPRLPPEQAAQLIADCWNLGENLERAPVWLRRIFSVALAERAERDVTDLRALVADVSTEALGEPVRRLGRRFRRRWVHLAEDDPRFLPGRVQFVAPAVVAVHDRLREDPEARESPTVGVWLRDPPLYLGPLGSLEPPASDPGLNTDLLQDLARADPTAGEWHSMASNPWRAAVTLELSQYLVALLPE